MTYSPPSKWIDVDSSKYDPGEPSLGQEVQFKLYLSPYDMPEAVRGMYDHSQKRFVIELKYIGDESLRSEPIDRYVTFWVGKKSRRVYRIAVDVDALGAKEVVLHVSQAIERLGSKLSRRSLPTDNLRVAKSIFTDNAPELLRPLLAR